MKRTTLLIIMAVLFACSTVGARTIIVKVKNIRGEQGAILVMAQSGKEKPVCGMAKVEKGEATITLENVEWDQFDLSVFHDENDNYTMDFTEDKKPAEGYAMKSFKPKEDEETVKLKLYYPDK